MRFAILLLLWPGCDRVFGLDDVKVVPVAPDGVLVDSTTGTHVIGCADGTREAFENQPQIAGCAGSWKTPGIPGIVGDVGGASALCESGWHICDDGAEATRKAPIDGCGLVIDPSMFFATAQRSSHNDLCDGGGNDDVFGCSSMLGVPVGSCGMLNHSIGTFTSGIGQWFVGTEDNNELANVTKGVENGGVLCCIDDQ